MPPNSGPFKPDSDSFQDYTGALNTIRSARAWFFLILMLSLLTHLTAYGGSRWGHVFDASKTVESTTSSTASPELISQEETSEKVLVHPNRWYDAAELVLPLAEFLGQLSCFALLVCYLLASNIALSGRLGGVRGSLNAFFGVLVVFAILFPWERWFGGLQGHGQIPGVYFTLGEVTHIPTEFANRLGEILHYVRYLGYPLLAVIIVFVADRRYAKGYRLAQRQIAARLNVRAV
jgi:hypothetical protein